jgi:16S rRNA (uracil1498-N3)-methyltransferase
MNLFLAEHIDENGGYLGPEESHHASKVLRLAPGDSILVTLGKGFIYRAVVREVNKKSVSFRITGVFSEERSERKLSIAIAPTKSNERFENFLEKATELGIHRIIPIICRNSERRVYKVERGRKVIMAAAKQSLSANWPELIEPVDFDKFIRMDAWEDGFIAHCGESDREELLPNLAVLKQALVLIGPEGDFTADEVAMAQKTGFKPVSLGKKRLRTETAGMAVSLAFNLYG